MDKKSVSRNSGYSSHQTMSGPQFERFSRFIQSHLGIRMPGAKKTMLESRLNKRLRALGINSFKDYEKYLFSEKGQEKEIPQLIDVVTTNTTYFFREGQHFDLLSEVVLPKWWEQHSSEDRIFNIWSAGCSTGEESYTLAIVLKEFAEKHQGFNFSVLGTDISNEVVQTAKRAVYPEEKVEEFSDRIKRKYLMRSRDKNVNKVRVVPEMRKQVQFQVLNFLDDFEIKKSMDVIFCRNVIIYFEKAIQEHLIQKLYRHLNPGGFLFIGHSETLAGLDVPLKLERPTVYRK